MSTFADIRKAAESEVRTAVDDDTPNGHFLATAKVLGIVTTYLLAGDKGNPSASIVGRIEYLRFPTAYIGSGLKGGRLMSADPGVLAEMVRRAQEVPE